MVINRQGENRAGRKKDEATWLEDAGRYPELLAAFRTRLYGILDEDKVKITEFSHELKSLSGNYFQKKLFPRDDSRLTTGNIQEIVRRLVSFRKSGKISRLEEGDLLALIRLIGLEPTGFDGSGKWWEENVSAKMPRPVAVAKKEPVMGEGGLATVEERIGKILAADHWYGRLNGAGGLKRKDYCEELVKEELEKVAGLVAKGGTVLVEGEPGTGKSLFIEHLIRTRPQNWDCCWYFMPESAAGEAAANLFRSLLAQLYQRYAGKYRNYREGREEFSTGWLAQRDPAALAGYFQDYLAKTGEVLAGLVNRDSTLDRSRRVVIFIDGLYHSQFARTLGRLLPGEVPPGVTLVLTYQPGQDNERWRGGEAAKLVLPPLDLERAERLFRFLLPEAAFEKLETGLKEKLVGAVDRRHRQLAWLAGQAREDKTPDLELYVREFLAEFDRRNPNQVFYSRQLNRLRANQELWYRAGLPLLGLLVASEKRALAADEIQEILGGPEVVSYDLIGQGLAAMEGALLRNTGRGYELNGEGARRFLYPEGGQTAAVFSRRDIEHKHRLLARWGERGYRDLIWEGDGQDDLERRRRKFARESYLEHLARDPQGLDHLLEVVREGKYGREKVRWDLAGRARFEESLDYAADLELAAEQLLQLEGSGGFSRLAMVNLPLFWQITLLRKSLRRVVERYPAEAFPAMAALAGDFSYALGLLERVSERDKKAKALLLLARQAEQPAEQKRLWRRAVEIQGVEVETALDTFFAIGGSEEEEGFALALLGRIEDREVLTRYRTALGLESAEPVNDRQRLARVEGFLLAGNRAAANKLVEDGFRNEKYLFLALIRQAVFNLEHNPAQGAEGSVELFGRLSYLKTAQPSAQERLRLALAIGEYFGAMESAKRWWKKALYIIEEELAAPDKAEGWGRLVASYGRAGALEEAYALVAGRAVELTGAGFGLVAEMARQGERVKAGYLWNLLDTALRSRARLAPVERRSAFEPDYSPEGLDWAEEKSWLVRKFGDQPGARLRQLCELAGKAGREGEWAVAGQIWREVEEESRFRDYAERDKVGLHYLKSLAFARPSPEGAVKAGMNLTEKIRELVEAFAGRDGSELRDEALLETVWWQVESGQGRAAAGLLKEYPLHRPEYLIPAIKAVAGYYLGQGEAGKGLRLVQEGWRQARSERELAALMHLGGLFREFYPQAPEEIERSFDGVNRFLDDCLSLPY